jgi:hypothetical protein
MQLVSKGMASATETMDKNIFFISYFFLMLN